MKYDISKKLIIQSINPVINNNSNSYINAYTEGFLRNAYKLGCYKGRFQGHYLDILVEWNNFIDDLDPEDIFNKIKEDK